MPFDARFECLSGCAVRIPVSEPAFRCPRCGGLLDVVHDVGALAARPAGEWKRLFDGRMAEPAAHRPSGVWSKHEWVMPAVREDCIVSMDEGYSSLLPMRALVRRLRVGEIWLKQCGNSHTGSFKDLGMTVLVSMVRQMRRDGRSIRAVACASTGDTSASLAAYAAAAGIPAVVLLPRGKISVPQLLQPLAHGALVLSLDTDFDGCMALVEQLADEGTVYLANSMNSLRLEGQKTVAVEIVQQLGWEAPDAVVIPGGNLGNVSALGAGFELMLALGVMTSRPRIAVAQAAAANPLYRAYRNGWNFAPVEAQPTHASAIRIGNPVSVQRAIRALKAFDGRVEQASEAELMDAAAEADRDGFFTCPQTGVALAALDKLAAAGWVGPRDRVVVVSTANGLKFPEFKRAGQEGHRMEGTGVRINRPLELPADLDAVRDAILAGGSGQGGPTGSALRTV